MAALGFLYVLACATFFNNYAFDDSYVGYSVAQSWLDGHGFTFNSNARVLSTSAPLAVPIYAAASALLRITVVQAAQCASALALGVLTFGTFALARRAFSAIGAFVAAAIVLCSPFTLLLWSHETLLYLATIVVGANLYVFERRTAAALVLGLASLFRGEALLVLPFFWIAEQRRGGWRSALAFAGLSLVPYVLWMALATWYFGTFLSATIASKHAQFFYPGIPSYLVGLVDFVIVLYGFTPSFGWGVGVAFACLVCCIVAVGYGIAPRVAAAVGIWVAATTALYLGLRLPFYFWFASQFGIGMAVAAACAWPRAANVRRGPLLAFARGASLVLVAINAAFLCIGAAHRTFPAHGAVAGVMSNLHDNAYRSLGQWFAQHAATHDTISFAEFGQLRYYSGRDVVDYLGLVTPGAASQLAHGNAIWTFKRYHPTWVVDSPPWQLFVSPTEYDWFRAAYGRVTELHFPGDPIRNDFIIYRLRDPQAIPAADVSSTGVTVGSIVSTPFALDVPFELALPGAYEFETRIAADRACRSIVVELLQEHRPIARATRALDPRVNPSRVTLAFAPLARAGSYHARIRGCGVHLAGTPQPERSFTVYRTTTDPSNAR